MSNLNVIFFRYNKIKEAAIGGRLSAPDLGFHTAHNKPQWQ